MDLPPSDGSMSCLLNEILFIPVHSESFPWTDLGNSEHINIIVHTYYNKKTSKKTSGHIWIVFIVTLLERIISLVCGV
jgi:hypothetical protein